MSETKIKKKRGPRSSQIILNAAIIFLFALGLYPLLMALWCAFKTPNQYTLYKWFPTLPLRGENIALAWDKIDGYMLRTIAVAVLSTASTLIVTTMAGFSVAKLRFAGSGFLLALILGLNMVPGVLTLVPVVMLYHSLGLNNTLAALILPGTFSTGTTFLLICSFRGIPDSLFEAAEIDGANDFQKYAMFGVPLAVPIIATIAIMQFSGTWSDFSWPMLIMTRENYTIAAGLKVEFYDATVSMPVSFAAYLLASVPLIVLFFFTNRVYAEGIVSSGLKL